MRLEHSDYKNLTWGPLTAVLGTVVIFFGGQIIAGIVLYLILLAYGWDTDRITAWFGGGGSAQFALSISISLVTLGLLYFFLKRRKAKLADIGLVRPRLKDAGYALAGLGVYITFYIFIVSVLARLFTSLNLEQQQELGFDKASTGSALVMVFIALVVLPPLVEEIISRGFLFSGLRRGFKFLPAALITSLIFGIAHLPGGEGGSTIWIAFIDTFVLSMVLVYLRERTGSLWPSIGLHGLKNLVAFLVLFVFKIS